MELRHLRYFVAVAEHLHFGRAAEALHTVQPSLSQQIRQLEFELGVELFTRTNRKVALTEAGHVFLAEARKTLAQAELSIERVRESVDGVRGRLRLGFVSGAILGVLPPVMRAYRMQFPQVEIVPERMSHRDQLIALHAGTIDLALVMSTVDDPELHEAEIFQDRLVAALPADHRLANVERVRIGDLGDDPLVVVTKISNPSLYYGIVGACAADGYAPQRIVEVPDGPTVAGFIAAGIGISLVPALWESLAVPGVVYRPLSVRIGFGMSLCWHRDRYSRIADAFVTIATELDRARRPAVEGVPQAV
jgi:DNA-binding transcriptional LysR family regulator